MLDLKFVFEGVRNIYVLKLKSNWERCNMPKANICLIGLSNQFVDQFGLGLSKKLDMFYANVQKIIEFELLDMHKMEEVCGKDYLEKKETSIIKRICTYENTILNVEYQLLNSDINFEILKNACIIVYLKIDKNRYWSLESHENLSNSVKLINSDLFEDRNFICEKKADIVVDCLELSGKELHDKFLEEIVKYYA